VKMVLISDPSDVLKFKFELQKQLSVTLMLHNPTGTNAAFKVKTTKPKKYCVRPNTGIVRAGSTTEIQVTMQAQRTWPSDLNACRDKFLVQSTEVTEEDPSLTKLFSSGRDGISETKLKVAYEVQTPPSPVAEDGEAEFPEVANGAGQQFSTAQSPRAAATATRPPTSNLESAMSMKSALSEPENEPPSAPQSSQNLQISKSQHGFTFVHLFLIAIVSFCLGRFF